MMKAYVVERIDEDDFGCEERPEGQPLLAVVTLSSDESLPFAVRVPDKELYELDINEGDRVVLDENGRLIKAR